MKRLSLIMLFSASHAFTGLHSAAVRQRSPTGVRKHSRSGTRATTPRLNLGIDSSWISSTLEHVVSSQHAFHVPHFELLDKYATLLREKPIITKASTAAVLAFIGDSIAQNSAKAESGTKYDFKRGLAFFAFGALYTGCFQHHWFAYLTQHIQDWGEDLYLWGHPAETTIPVIKFAQNQDWWEYFDVKYEIDRVMESLLDPPTQFELAAAKVAVNQFLVIPSLYMPLFFLVTGLLAGLDRNKIVARAQSLYIPLLKRNYMFWIPLQMAQFLVVPIDLQVPFVCVASLVWTVILSNIGGSTSQQNVKQEIVAYETTLDLETGEEVYNVIPVDVGPVNAFADSISYEDIEKVVIPQQFRDVVEKAEEVTDSLARSSAVSASATGLATGLIVSAADDAVVGAALGTVIGGDAGAGVAIAAAVGAGAGYIVSRINSDQSFEDMEDEAKPQSPEKATRDDHTEGMALTK